MATWQKTSYNQYWKHRHNGEFKKNRCGRNWYRFDLLEDRLPRIPCVYVIYFDGVISYVGSTINLYRRFNECHKIKVKDIYAGKGKLKQLYSTRWGDFSDAYVKVRFSDFLGDWAQKEIYLIDRIRPRFNKTYNWSHG